MGTPAGDDEPLRGELVRPELGAGGVAKGKVGKKGPNSELVMYFANITAWNLKAEKFFGEAAASDLHFDLFGIAEHHLLPLRLGPVRRAVGRMGFATAVAPARLGPGGGTVSGVMVSTAKRPWSVVPERPVVKAPGGIVDGSVG